MTRPSKGMMERAERLIKSTEEVPEGVGGVFLINKKVMLATEFQKIAEEHATILEISTDELKLHCGEMTAQEIRTIKAVLKWKAAAIRDGGEK